MSKLLLIFVTRLKLGSLALPVSGSFRFLTLVSLSQIMLSDASKLASMLYLFIYLIEMFICNTVKPLLRGNPVERPTPLERSTVYEKLRTNVLNSTRDERPPLFKGHISGEKEMAFKRGSTVYCGVVAYPWEEWEAFMVSGPLPI